MTKDKKIKQEELENANGGHGYGIIIKCESCREDFDVYYTETRENGSGCDKVTEAKCPNCGHWNVFAA